MPASKRLCLAAASTAALNAGAAAAGTQGGARPAALDVPAVE